MKVPDSIEPYIGWKALRLNGDGTLSSPQVRSRWPVGERLEATCQHGDAITWKWVEVPDDEAESLIEEDMTFTFGSLPPMPPKRPREGYTWFPRAVHVEHEVVDKDCSCGIYAVNHPLHCFGYLDNHSVLAQVAIWGKTVIATHGVRGQYAYPQKLVAPGSVAEQAALAGELYGVPVEIEEELVFMTPPMRWAPPRSQHQASLVPLTLALLVSSFAAVLALLGQGSLLLSTLSATLVITAIIYTKVG